MVLPLLCLQVRLNGFSPTAGIGSDVRWYSGDDAVNSQQLKSSELVTFLKAFVSWVMYYYILFSDAAQEIMGY